MSIMDRLHCGGCCWCGCWLQDYSPDYCLALLALPLDDLQRQRGHVLLRKLLWELPDDLSPLGADKDEFLAAARGLLTPQEHVSISYKHHTGSGQPCLCA